MTPREMFVLRASAIALSLLSTAAQAEPYLALREGHACAACHVNPTGGGLRNEFGAAYAANVMSARRLPPDAPVWTGRVNDWVRLGADLRTSWNASETPDDERQQQAEVDQLRAYLQLEPIPGRVSINIDELLAPGNATTQEAYVRYSEPERGWYLKAGKFYVPFGWRLQDNTAFVREASGINMTTPDDGAEVGFERASYSAQLAVTNGAANAGAGSGFAATTQFVYLRPRWRAGLAASYTDSSAGARRVGGLFAGVRTGAVVWLGEIDAVRDDGFPEGTRTYGAGLAEADWSFAAGHNLKLTAEYLDPDRRVDEDAKTRYSLLYEFTPLPFLQVRLGVRDYDGIPQAPLDNRRVSFAEVHGFF